MGHKTELMFRAALSAITICATPAMAQSQAETQANDDGSLSEIVVTAQRREESQLETPVSLVALSTRQIENKSIFDISDLPRAVPNLQVGPHPNSANTARIFIRGIGNSDDQFTQDPSVAVYVDGVYVARTQGLVNEIAEIERIEVLRGPQGTLFGRNATGGAINFITKPPELDTFKARQELTVGNFDQFRSRTTLNLPVGQTLAIQGGYLHASKDGFVRNPGIGSRRFGDQRRDAYRAAVRWAPSDDYGLTYVYDRSDTEDTPPYLAVVPAYPAQGKRPKVATTGTNLTPNRSTSQGHGLTAFWNVSPAFQIKSITAYRKLSNDVRQAYFPGLLAAAPVLSVANLQHQDQFSQEIQLLGTLADGTFDYIVGGYYFTEDGDSVERQSSLFAPTENRVIAIGNDAKAVYGQATYRPKFAPGAYVTGGLRWSKDDRKAQFDRTLTPLAGGTPAAQPRASGDRSFDNVSPTLIIGYAQTDDLNVYAKYARGYKSGGFNIRASSAARFAQGFGPEVVDSYEIGAKFALIDRKVRLNLAAFKYDYKDIQINVITNPANPTITDTFNAGGARIKGIEADLTARPIRSMTIGLNYAYLDAKYTEILDGVGNDVTNRYQFQNAPKNSFTANVTQTFPETGIGRPEIYVNYSIQSRRFANTGDRALVFKSFELLDARISLTDIPLGVGRWTLAAFGKNLLNEDYYVHHFRVVQPAAIYGEPRTYGLQLTFEY
ncbi:TonB-dependent receptor [Sphingomonas crocodyli]|uniref:TonB-dependent receptor n=1 Tax=Sphingomonas crocodyli TaxID=1979270 RepID=A0A437M6C8_9SPHN|nr:TonB-dependent receptor [Sphingomonas crocodyli]RVT93115.1 TonB-dependent receptor [Sphingomonas crocodyli]